MKLLSLCIATLLFACGGGSVCEGDNCVCPAGEDCAYDCEDGGAVCNVQCQPGTACDVGCASGEPCNVECSQSSSCNVDCANGTNCDITCPATGCRVTNCTEGNCSVTCGLAGGATYSGSTATCP